MSRNSNLPTIVFGAIAVCCIVTAGVFIQRAAFDFWAKSIAQSLIDNGTVKRLVDEEYVKFVRQTMDVKDPEQCATLYKVFTRIYMPEDARDFVTEAVVDKCNKETK